MMARCNTYVYTGEPSTLIIVCVDRRGVVVSAYFDATSISYALKEDHDYVFVETPILGVRLDDDRVVNHVLDELERMLLDKGCKKASVRGFILYRKLRRKTLSLLRN